MGCFGTLIMIAIIVVIIFAIVKFKEAQDMEAARLRRLDEERMREKQEKESTIKEIGEIVSEIVDRYINDIYEFFTNTDSPYHVLGNALDEAYSQIIRAQLEVQKIDKSKNYAGQLKTLSEFQEKLRKHANTIHLTMFHEQEETYGMAYGDTIDKINALNRTTAMEKIASAAKLVERRGVSVFMAHLNELLTLDPYELICCVWYFATTKPFSASDFKYSVDVYNRVFRESVQESPDILAAQLYAKNEMAGEDAIMGDLRDTLKDGNWQAATLMVLASAMMWMQCYKAESLILSFKLDNGIDMTQKEQERLHALSSGNGNAPKIHDVNDDGFMFDISPLTWKDDEYRNFFDNLQFQSRNLPYALAVRDDDHDLLVPAGIKAPSDEQVLRTLCAAFEEEYGDSAKIDGLNCVAVSDATKERYVAYLAWSKECPQLGVLVRVVKIGKHINIKFYTLYIPQDIPANEEVVQTVALKNKLTLMVNMWEKGIKDTMLMAIQQLLNKESTVDPMPVPQTQPENDAPVF